ncbi:MAG: hypothetical protein IT324_04710 [Anaerolineae bacterium]|nr:hypothetical protein [Anaerolineae bacterium]
MAGRIAHHRSDLEGNIRTRNLAWVIGLLLIGFFLRTTDVGAAPLQGDEAWNAFLAFQSGHLHQRPELGVVSSSGLNQSPFFHDVFTVPFLLNPDPRVARLFMAAIHLVSMAVLYRFARRFWSERTALAALVLYTFMPRAIWSGRYLWNPYLVTPFLIGFYATGFWMIAGKRWARWLHFASLACVIQAHPSAVVNGLLTLIFVALDLRRSWSIKRRFVVDYGIGVALAGLLFLPWAIGFIHQRANAAPDSAAIRLRNTTSPADMLKFVIDSPTSLDVGAFTVRREDFVVLPTWAETANDAIGWFTLIAAVIVLARGLIQRRARDAIMGLAYLVMPVTLLFVPTRTYYFYLTALLPAGAILQALALFGDERRPRWLLRFGALAAGILVIYQVGLVAAGLQSIHNYNHYSRESIMGLDAMTKFRDAAERPGVETIYLVEMPAPVGFVQGMVWMMLATKGPSRVIWGDQFALPVPDAGATYVGYSDAVHIPELFASPQPRLTVNNLYRVVDLPPHSVFTPTCRPQGPTRLNNSATILGYYTPQDSQPRPGQPWTIYVLWQGQSNDQHAVYQLFNHLVTADDKRIAQADIPGLSTDMWRVNEQLVSKITLAIPDTYRPDQPLTLRVGMYTLPAIKNAAVIDDAGNEVASWVTIPICH